jgi:hypothetical protein
MYWVQQELNLLHIELVTVSDGFAKFGMSLHNQPPTTVLTIKHINFITVHYYITLSVSCLPVVLLKEKWTLYEP